jgi:hypothetical protein
MLKKLLLISALSFGTALPVFADVVSDLVVANLKAQGFVVIQMDRTWLGRMWIMARNDEVQREVVFNPVTGEILRDYTVLLTALQSRESGSDKVVASTGTTIVPPAMVGAPPVTSSSGADALQNDEPELILSSPINPVQ